MSESLLEFPCDFPLKVMGRKEPGFSETIVALVEAHAGPLDEGRVRLRESRDGNFVALTIMMRAGSQEELDTIYGALSAHDQVLIVL
jgi:uncharacterized protein